MSSLVLIAHNAREQLLAALDRLSHHVGWTRLVVVDNGSDDGVAGAVRELFPATVVVQLGNEVDWATAERAGRAFARGDDCAVVWLSETSRVTTVRTPELVGV